MRLTIAAALVALATPAVAETYCPDAATVQRMTSALNAVEQQIRQVCRLGDTFVATTPYVVAALCDLSKPVVQTREGTVCTLGPQKARR